MQPPPGAKVGERVRAEGAFFGRVALETGSDAASECIYYMI